MKYLMPHRIQKQVAAIFIISMLISNLASSEFIVLFRKGKRAAGGKI